MNTNDIREFDKWVAEREIEPREKRERDRSLRGKARIRARRTDA